jgi:hypothetical protein
VFSQLSDKKFLLLLLYCFKSSTDISQQVLLRQIIFSLLTSKFVLFETVGPGVSTKTPEVDAAAETVLSEKPKVRCFQNLFAKVNRNAFHSDRRQ